VGRFDNITAICEPTVYKMLKRRRLRSLRAWASTACYRTRSVVDRHALRAGLQTNWDGAFREETGLFLCCLYGTERVLGEEEEVAVASCTLLVT
jgi:hypothetical protein